MVFKKTFLFFSLILLLSQSTLAWGPVGHQIVGKIAQNFLSAKAWGSVQVINGQGVTLEAVSTIPDDYSHGAGGGWSKPYHYINVPREYTSINMRRDCPTSACVVAAIQNYTNILSSRPPARWTLAEPSPVTFLVHYMGDIHQPLHVGYAHDRGGNDVNVKFFGKTKNLHSIWDSGLITESRKTKDQVYQEVLNYINSHPDVVQRWRSNISPLEIGNESYNIVRRDVYNFKDNVIDNSYLNANWNNVITRLAAAGVRLAHVLNTIYK